MTTYPLSFDAPIPSDAHPLEVRNFGGRLWRVPAMRHTYEEVPIATHGGSICHAVCRGARTPCDVSCAICHPAPDHLVRVREVIVNWHERGYTTAFEGVGSGVRFVPREQYKAHRAAFIAADHPAGWPTSRAEERLLLQAAAR